jgi:hypothetical protein
MAPSATPAANKRFIGDGAVVSYLTTKETIMKLTAIALATSFALCSTGVFAHTVRHGSNVRAHTIHRDAASFHPKYDNPSRNFSAYGNHDVWGQWGAYYGPMISVGAGGR